MLPFFHVDQRPHRARCEALIATVPPPGSPDHYVRLTVARIHLVQLLHDCRLVDGASPETVRNLVIGRVLDNEPEVGRRVLAGAIPAKGPLRRGRVAAAAIVGCLLVIALWCVSPLVLFLAMLIGLGRYLWTWLQRPIWGVAKMLVDAQTAARRGDGVRLRALYDEARQMIIEDRVPEGSGNLLGEVLQHAAHATPFPTEIRSTLWQLLLLAPEIERGYQWLDQDIESALQGRILDLAQVIRRGLTANAVTAVATGLDEVEYLVVAYEAQPIPPPRTSMPTVSRLEDILDMVEARATDPAMVARARGLLERLTALFVAESGVQPARRRRRRRPHHDP